MVSRQACVCTHSAESGRKNKRRRRYLCAAKRARISDLHHNNNNNKASTTDIVIPLHHATAFSLIFAKAQFFDVARSATSPLIRNTPMRLASLLLQVACLAHAWRGDEGPPSQSRPHNSMLVAGNDAAKNFKARLWPENAAAKRRRERQKRREKLRKQIAQFDIYEHPFWYTIVSLIGGAVLPAVVLGAFEEQQRPPPPPLPPLPPPPTAVEEPEETSASATGSETQDVVARPRKRRRLFQRAAAVAVVLLAALGRAGQMHTRTVRLEQLPAARSHSNEPSYDEHASNRTLRQD